MPEINQDIKNKLGDYRIYQVLKEKCADEDENLISLVDEAVSYACSKTKAIITHMRQYTLHDEEHLFRVLHLMGKLISEEQISKLSKPELMLLILSAFFHDLGMAPEEHQVITWKKSWDANPELEENEQDDFQEFNRYLNSIPAKFDRSKQLLATGKTTEAQSIIQHLISEFIRKTHAKRATEIIERDWREKIKFRDYDLTVDLAHICKSHNDPPNSILKLDKHLICADGIYCSLPIVALFLRLADVLDFDGKRTPSVLFSHLYITNPISLTEWQKHRSIQSWEINPDSVIFSAKCKHPAIELSIHKFCDYIDYELSSANRIISNLNSDPGYSQRDISFKVPFQVSREKIKTEVDFNGGPIYLFKDSQFSLSKKQVINILMGTKLYGNTDSALRELIQNSIDACLLRKSLYNEWGEAYEPEIKITYKKVDEEYILTVNDNGIGMDQYIIDNYFSNIGSSYYNSEDFYSVQSITTEKFKPISRFGIGILSCFMISDVIKVETKRVLDHNTFSDPLNVLIEGEESIFHYTKGARRIPGTEITLHIRPKKNPWDHKNSLEFIKAVEKVIPNPPVKINIETDEDVATRTNVDFSELDITKHKTYSWEDLDVVQEYVIEFKKEENLGFEGKVLVGILFHEDKPIDNSELNNKTYKLDEEDFEFKRKVRAANNGYIFDSKGVAYDKNGDLKPKENTNWVCNSKSIMSLHGIEISTTLFPNTTSNNQAEIKWPIPMIMVIDVNGKGDLDLNASRTMILATEKFSSFEEELLFAILDKLHAQLGEENFKSYIEILERSTITNDNFKKGLNRIKETYA